MKILEGNHNLLEDEPDGLLKGEQKFYNPFHDVIGDGGCLDCKGVEERLVCALDLNGG